MYAYKRVLFFSFKKSKLFFLKLLFCCFPWLLGQRFRKIKVYICILHQFKRDIENTSLIRVVQRTMEVHILLTDLKKCPSCTVGYDGTQWRFQNSLYFGPCFLTVEFLLYSNKMMTKWRQSHFQSGGYKVYED